MDVCVTQWPSLMDGFFPKAPGTGPTHGWPLAGTLSLGPPLLRFGAEATLGQAGSGRAGRVPVAGLARRLCQGPLEMMLSLLV